MLKWDKQSHNSGMGVSAQLFQADIYQIVDVEFDRDLFHVTTMETLWHRWNRNKVINWPVEFSLSSRGNYRSSGTEKTFNSSTKDSVFNMRHICKIGRWFYVHHTCVKSEQQEIVAPLYVNLPSESSSSSSASFSRTSAGRLIPTAGVESNIIVSRPVEVLSAMVVQKDPRKAPPSGRWGRRHE